MYMQFLVCWLQISLFRKFGVLGFGYLMWNNDIIEELGWVELWPQDPHCSKLVPVWHTHTEISYDVRNIHFSVIGF